jgi:hypothetical protein
VRQRLARFYRLAAAEIAFVINDARAKIVFVDDSFVPVIAEIHDQLHAVDLIVMTSDSFSSWRDSQSGKDPALEAAQDDVSRYRPIDFEPRGARHCRMRARAGLEPQSG